MTLRASQARTSVSTDTPLLFSRTAKQFAQAKDSIVKMSSISLVSSSFSFRACMWKVVACCWYAGLYMNV